MNLSDQKIFDVIVIGGGPAGMMAAGRAASLGKSVLLLEKNISLGKKLLITGGGRCNITNNKTNIRTMLSKYKGSDKFLFSAFSQFAVNDTINFFKERGLDLKEENDGRMFPITDSAGSVFEVLESYMKEEGVEVKTNSSVSEIKKDNEYFYIKAGKDEFKARACIVATGGTSRPDTGSTGDGFKWLQKLGHKIIENDMALVPIALRDAWAKKLGGVALSNIKLTLSVKNEKLAIQKGKMLFTHFGISGPAVLNLSRDVGEALEYNEATIYLDLFPHLDPGALKEQFYLLLEKENNKKLKNTLGELIPSSMVVTILELAGVNGEDFNNSVSRESRIKLINLFKKIPLTVKGLLGSDKAIVSSGGVDLSEVDFKTMQSRSVNNLFLVGDVLNIDRPSGGYSLQLCWTTGFIAGSNA